MGEYAAADRLLRPLLGISAAMSLSALPTVAAYAERREFPLLRRTFWGSVGRTSAVIGAILVLAWPGSAWLLHRFAPEYQGALWPFRILLVGALFMFLNQLARTYLLGLGRYRDVMFSTAASLALYAVLGLVMIPRHGALGGAMGAALATAITEALASVALVLVVLVGLKKSERAAAQA
jgi:O-antigen/teichoic acid export membrane protein